MNKNLNLEGVKIALDYAQLCVESIERNEMRLKRNKQKLEELKIDNTLYSVAEEYDIKSVIKKCELNIENKKQELKQQLDFIAEKYDL